MKDIFNNYRNGELIKEAAYGPEDLPEDHYISYDTSGNSIAVVVVDYDGDIIRDEDGEPFATLYAEYADEGYDKEGPCLGSYIIKNTRAEDGFGPLIYDVAMELATSMGAYLTADRQSVSREAYRVWKYYLENRDDVSWDQMDNHDNDLTPQNDDNCSQSAATKWASKSGTLKWPDVAISKAFRKDNTDTIDHLEDLDLIRECHSPLFEKLTSVDDHHIMTLRNDEFIHFTTKERAQQIIKSGKLLMKPPYDKFGTDTVDAVSLVYGSYVPTVQLTHTERISKDIVGVVFKTETIPDIGFPEEVKWSEDVVLINPKIVSMARGVSLLKSAPYSDMIEGSEQDYVRYV